MNVASGNVTLEVEASPPAKSRDPVLILAHPHPKMGGSMHNKVVDQIFRRSQERGWGVVRFNFRGVENSTGEFDNGIGETEDEMSVLSWASTQFERPISNFDLVGYSFGSWISARVAARLPKIRRLFLVAPPINIMDFSPLAGSKHSKLIFGAEKDEIVPLTELRNWYENLNAPKTFQVIPEADHFFIGQTTELIRSVLRAIED